MTTLSLDTVIGYTNISVLLPSPPAGPGGLAPDLVDGATVVRVITTPDLSENPSIELALNAYGAMVLIEPDEADPDDPDDAESFTNDLGFTASGPPLAWTQRRASLQVSVAMPTPIIVKGNPVVPAYRANIISTSTAVLGSGHIHAVDLTPDPTAKHPPDNDAATPDWAGRWVVDDLPDPPSNGYYWLGAPSSADGTAGVGSAQRQWAPHGSTPDAPSWHSFYPFKPSVRAFDSYLPGGGIVHHPKGVHFNSHFIEHMWLDFGAAKRQPFTWVFAGMIASFPATRYTHYLLDAGRNPDDVGFPRLSDTAVNDGRTINDGLSYRNLISYSRHGQRLCSRPNAHGQHTLRSRVHNNLRPKMFFGVFNGANSMTGAFGPNSRRHDVGAIDNTSAQAHRYYVMGREQTKIDQDRACHMLIFEIRYWRAALTLDQLDSQHRQLSSRYQFHRYKGV